MAPKAAVQPTCLPEHAAMGHCTPATPQAAPPPPPPVPQPTCLPEHAAMGHCTPATPPPSTPAAPACLPEHAAMGHCTPAAPATVEGTDLPAGNAPAPEVPVANAADAVYGTPAMAMGRHHLNHFHGGQKLSQVMINLAEARFGKGPTAFEWDGEGWYGGDIDRLWVKSEGEGAFGRSIEKAEVQALYSKAVGPYFNLQGGVRYDIKPNPSRTYAVAGFEGLAPRFFDVEGALFLSNKGELMARFEGSYDQRITQRLILQPRAEVNFAAQSTRSIGVGAGLSDAELGLRLRYDIRREFAPYVGVQYERAFGDTRRFRHDAGERAGGWSLLTGIRAWF
jgi:copper resistance protein B